MPGRPKKAPDGPEEVSFRMRADQKFLDKIDELRKAEDDLPTRSDMVRRLVDRAHKATRTR